MYASWLMCNAMYKYTLGLWFITSLFFFVIVELVGFINNTYINFELSSNIMKKTFYYNGNTWVLNNLKCPKKNKL